jgi:ABC-type branched-subunit amino acid transport system substrate-binding protein
MKRQLAGPVAALAALLLTASACSTSGPESSEADSGSDGVKMGPGVTDDTIKLAALADLSGVFATAGTSLAHAQQVYFEQLNEKGGICDRDVELDIKDTGYDVQKTVTQYAQVKDEVLGFPSIIGGPMNVALFDSLAKDDLLAIPVSWSSSLLESPHEMLSGPASEYWVINAVDYLMSEDLLPEGGTVGVVHLEGESGDAVFEGAKAAAELTGVKLVDQEVKADATDMSGVVTSFKSANVDAMILNTTPTMTASVAGSSQAQGVSVPMVTVNGGAFNPDLLKTDAAEALEKNLYIALPWRMSDDNADVADLVAGFKEEFPDDSFNENVMWGFGAAAAFADILRQACDAGDLTREGVATALSSASEVDSLGLLVPLDYTTEGATPSRSIFINKIDPDGLASETVLTDEPYLGPSAEKYELD